MISTCDTPSFAFLNGLKGFKTVDITTRSRSRCYIRCNVPSVDVEHMATLLLWPKEGKNPA